MGGFVGGHLAARLIHDGWDVAGTVRPGTGDHSSRLTDLGVAGIPTDLADPDETRRALRAADPDVVFLLAAARTRDVNTLAVNATSVAWLLDALPDRCRAVVRLGSSTEYASIPTPMDESTPVRPRSFFGATKAAGSAILLAADRPRTAVLRAFQVYGPGDHPNRLVPATLHAARTGTTLPLTGPGQRRDWVYVDDVVDACVRAATADHLPTAQVFNIGTGVQTANEELVALAADVTGRPIRTDVGAEPPRSWDTHSWVADSTLARQLLAWTPAVPLEEGLRRCWIASQP